MKTIMIIAFMLVSLYTQAQIELKGIKTGELYYGEQVIMTSVADIPGALIVYTLNDKRVYMLAFTPSENGILESYIYEHQVETLVKAFEENYKIVFNKKEKEYLNEYTLWAKKLNHNIAINVKITKYRSPSYRVIAFITNNDLKIISDKEDLERAKNDL
jgi:hypothetical protein